MAVNDMLRPRGEAGSLRAGLLLLVVLGVVGTALALAYDRHWQSPWQLAPWITLGAISLAWVTLVARRSRATVRVARAVAVLTLVVAMLGVWRHVEANYNAEGAADHHAAEPAATSDDSADDEASSGGHHGDDDEASSGGHHDDEEAASDATDSGASEPGSSEVTLVDAMTGSAGHAPVPSALAIVPVGLALALATIGLGGARRSSEVPLRSGVSQVCSQYS